MARELSQAELLDFLCRAGGRVANAALLGHFRRFLRDPRAEPAQLQHRRRLFKGFVNSVATVRQDGAGAATYVVLRKRYRDLIGEEEEEEEARPPPDRRPGPQPPAPAARSPHQPARWDGGGGGKPPPGAAASSSASSSASSPRELLPDPRREAEGDGRGSDGEGAAGRRRRRRSGAGRCLPATPEVGSRPPPPPPASPTLGCLGREKKAPRQPLAALEKPPHSNGLGLPVGEMGAGGVQQRIRDWIVAHHAAEAAEGACPAPAWSHGSDRSSCRPCGSLDFGPASESSEGWRDHPPVPVFRSIRCRLSLQDLEDHLERESSASEEEGSSSASGSQSRGGEAGRTNGCNGHTAGRQGPGGAPHGNGLVMPPLVQATQDSEAGKSPPHVVLLHRMVGRAATLGKTEGRDGLKPRKVGRPPSPNLDAPLSPWWAPRQRPLANAPFVERQANPNPDGPAEHRPSSAPLDGREHTWLVKIATGSWMQVRALLQEDPQLVLHRDFISGFTVLHWLAKHGDAQVLQDLVTGAQEAGIVLDANVRSGCGYTPLHLAAIHSHPLVMKILVQRLQCRTQVRDSSGKKAWQYLNANTSGDIWQLLGGPRGRTIFPAHPIVRPSPASPSAASLARKVSRKPSLANYLKPQHLKRKKGGCQCAILQEVEEYSD